MDNLITARAKAKLKRIIKREGTANGARLTPEYFEMLVEEVKRDYEAEQIYSGGVL